MNSPSLKYQGLIAPCGMNCGICIGHMRKKKPCGGCKGTVDRNKPENCKACGIARCEFLARTGSGFCYDCDRYPCTRLRRLDKRYRTNYGMSMIENLEFVNNRGLEAFIIEEEGRWKCPECGSGLCVHRDSCIHCKSVIE